MKVMHYCRVGRSNTTGSAHFCRVGRSHTFWRSISSNVASDLCHSPARPWARMRAMYACASGLHLSRRCKWEGSHQGHSRQRHMQGRVSSGAKPQVAHAWRVPLAAPDGKGHVRILLAPAASRHE